MKITQRQLRRIIREESFRALLSEASPEIENVGDLKAALAAASGKKRDEQGKAALKDFGKGFLADLIPGGGTVLSIHDLLKSTYTMDDEARTGTALDYLDVDDNISAIVDNPIETKFLNALAKEVEAMSDDTPLEDLNMTNLLSRYLKGEFNQRTVAGFEEGKKLKITRRQLKRIIREAVASWKRTPGSTGKRRLKGEKEFTLRVRQEEVIDFVVLADDEQQARDDLQLFLNQGMPMEELRAGKWRSVQVLNKIDWDAEITLSGRGTDYSRDPMKWELDAHEGGEWRLQRDN